MADITDNRIKKRNPYWSEISKEDINSYNIMEGRDGNIHFFKLGTYTSHRCNSKPAFINYNRTVFLYFENGHLHNIRGPARIDREKRSFFLFNIQYSEEDWNYKTRSLMLLDKLKHETDNRISDG